MPLRCLDDTRDVFAFGLDDADWAALAAANRRDRHLRMHCCGAAVAAKTSRLGTRFFAHIARGGCATGDESPEHLRLKSLAVAAALAHGWTAETEVSGTAPDGSAWRADVLAARGKRRVAVEVQWSPQSDEETQRRQAQYAASGVRGLWLFRQRRIIASGEVPAVRIEGSLAKGFTALGLPVADVLAAAFDRRLKWGIPTGVTARIAVGGIVAACWHSDCSALNRAIDRVVITSSNSLCEIALSAFGDQPALAAAILPMLPPDRARGRIKPRFSRMQDRTYLSNGCFRCDRLLGEHFLTDLNSRFTIASGSVVIDDDWAALIAATPEFDPVWSVVAPPRPNG